MCEILGNVIWILSVAVLIPLVACWLRLINQRQLSAIKRINDSLDRTVDNCIDFNDQVRLLNKKRKDDA